MKRIIISIQFFLLTLLISIQGTLAQPVSDEVYYNRLYYLCKAWGHAKYYHTRIAAGLVNWDDELLPVVTAARNAPTDEDFNVALLAMLNSAGPMGTSNATLPYVPDSLNLNLDRSWIQSTFFSEPVRAILLDIQDKFRPQSNVYVGTYAASNPNFETDSMYYWESPYPTEEKRMLSMFRYWNQVNYFYPYKKIMDQDWDLTLQEFIPPIASATDELSFILAYRQFNAKIDDSHSYLNSSVYFEWLGYYYPPFEARFIENETVITEVLPGVTGVSVGDVIQAIDGVDIYTRRDQLRPYTHGSNETFEEYYLNQMVLRGPEGEFPVTVFDGTTTRSLTLSRNNTNYTALYTNTGPAWYDTVSSSGCTYGVVDMDLLETSMVADMFSALWNTDAIIFDIRNYPNGTLWTIVNYLFPAPIHNASFTKPDITYPGRLSWIDAVIGSGTNNPYPGKVIILFDERTISQAEYTCMGIGQFPGAIKIGSTTAAADGNVSRSNDPGRIWARMTGLGTYYPDHSPTQRVGIIPDYFVTPTIEGIRSGTDELLAYAMDCSLLETDYCTSTACNAYHEWVQDVSIGSFAKNSGYNYGYGDFTELPVELVNGTTYTLSVTPFIVNNLNRRQYIRVWIDLNKDGDFEEANELVLTANRTKVTVSSTVNIPTGLVGETRMRVAMKFNAAPTACEKFAYGEVEDYTLNFISPPAPVANFSGYPLEIDAGQTVQFTDLSTNFPSNWEWSFEGGTPASSTARNPVVTYNTAGVYDVSLTVNNISGANSLTKTNYITVNAGYCASQSTSNVNEYIGQVQVGSFTNTSGPSNYSYFPDPVIQFAPGATVNVVITPTFPKKSRPEYYRIWIDYNNDMDFTDSGEEVFMANATKNPASGSFIVPASASGTTRMRVSMKNGGAPSPCETFTGGEVEDYLVSFTGGTKSLEIVAGFQVELYPVPASDQLNIKISGNAVPVLISVHNGVGQLMDEFYTGSGTRQLNLTAYPKGLYYMKLQEKEALTRKFIRQ